MAGRNARPASLYPRPRWEVARFDHQIRTDGPTWFNSELTCSLTLPHCPRDKLVVPRSKHALGSRATANRDMTQRCAAFWRLLLFVLAPTSSFRISPDARRDLALLRQLTVAASSGAVSARLSSNPARRTSADRYVSALGRCGRTLGSGASSVQSPRGPRRYAGPPSAVGTPSTGERRFGAAAI